MNTRKSDLALGKPPEALWNLLMYNVFMKFIPLLADFIDDQALRLFWKVCTYLITIKNTTSLHRQKRIPA